MLVVLNDFRSGEVIVNLADFATIWPIYQPTNGIFNLILKSSRHGKTEICYESQEALELAWNSLTKLIKAQ